MVVSLGKTEVVLTGSSGVGLAKRRVVKDGGSWLLPRAAMVCSLQLPGDGVRHRVVVFLHGECVAKNLGTIDHTGHHHGIGNDG